MMKNSLGLFFFIAKENRERGERGREGESKI